MKKIYKKTCIAFLVMLLLLSTACLAATTSSEKAKMEIVENNICTINIQNMGMFEKKIIASDLEKKELTLQLKVTNTTEPIFNKPTEIMLVIDNSLSMKDTIDSAKTITRLKAVTDSAKTLATELLKHEMVSIGVVSFSTGSEEGTITDATLKTKPTKDAQSVLSAISEIAEGELGPRTNIDAGLTLGNQNFSENCESKYLILLTDGVPNTTVGGPTMTYSGETATRTKSKLNELKDDDVTIFSVMTGVSSTRIETSTNLTYKALAEEIFGTTQNPTVGKFYYIADSEIETTICETILGNFLDTSANTLTNLKIYDYFPKQIVDNFEFSYVTNVNKGTISPSIDLQNNLIIWTIETLEPKETATVSYKLKLKDTIDTSILDTILNTNQKVEITADQVKTEDGSNVLVSDVSPKVRITIPKVEPPVDNTITNTVIPQTGDSISTPMIFMTIILIACTIVAIRFYFLNRDIK